VKKVREAGEDAAGGRETAAVNVEKTGEKLRTIKRREETPYAS